MKSSFVVLTWLLSFCLLVEFSTLGQTFTVSQNDLKTYLREFSRGRSHKQQGEKNRVRNYITTFFSNLKTTTDLKSYTFATPLYGNGRNIIYTMKGSNWGTSADEVLLLGAHYDSQTNTPGVDDNGSGMAAMLAIAKLLSQASKTYALKSTVVFVAFDFEEFGLLGSQHFVKEVLMRDIVNPSKGTFHGAIILETLMNYNTANNSQAVPRGFNKVFPRESARLAANNYRGNFITTIGRLDEEKLLKNLTTVWRATTTGMNYPLPVSLTVPIRGRLDSRLAKFSNLFRSDHVPFWQSKTNLKAVQITDSANFRGHMRQCYHNPCDTLNNITPEMYQFLTCTTQTVFNYMFTIATGRKSQGKCAPTSGTTTLSPTSGTTAGPTGTASAMFMSTGLACVAIFVACFIITGFL